MADAIDTTVNARGAALFALDPAWHGLGDVLDHEFTKEEALAHAGIDFPVEKMQSGFFNERDGKWYPFPDNYTTVRTDTNRPLGVVKKTYFVFQNSEAFDGMDKILAEHGAKYHAAGVLHDGAKVWILAKLPEEFRVTPAEGDVIEEYLLLCTTHDGTGAIWCLPTGVRVVCANTLAAALGYRAEEARKKARAGKAVRIRHSRSAGRRLEEARDVFKIAHERMLLGIENAKRLVDVKSSEEMIVDSIASTLDTFIGPVEEILPDGTKRIIQVRQTRRNEASSKLLEAIIEETKLVGENAWAVYNGVTRFTDHGLSYRGKYAKENRFENLLMGGVDDFKRTLMESLVGKHLIANLITLAE